MPYLTFCTLPNQKVELSGNSETEFISKINSHNSIAFKELAIEWVKSFFRRRNAAIMKQKSLTADDETKAEEYREEELDAAEQEEEAKRAYQDAIANPDKAKTVTSNESQNNTQIQQTQLSQQEMTSNVHMTEDDFM